MKQAETHDFKMKYMKPSCICVAYVCFKLFCIVLAKITICCYGQTQAIK